MYTIDDSMYLLFVADIQTMHLRRGKFVKILVTRDGGDAFDATQQGRTARVQHQRYCRLYSAELS